MGMTRVDWNQSSKHRIFGSYFLDRNNRANPLAGSSTLANYMSESFIESTDVVVVNDVYTFSPHAAEPGDLFLEPHQFFAGGRQDGESDRPGNQSPAVPAVGRRSRSA